MRPLTILLLVSFSSQASVPFFDENPDTRFAPNYSFTNKPIDESVLQTCGEFGSTVSQSNVLDLLLKYPEVTNRLLSLDSTLSTEKLAEIWSKNNAFTHIFCGEVKPSKKGGWSLGGLHYAPRYKGLYEDNLISMCPPNQEKCVTNKHEVVEKEGVYSIPVAFQTKDGKSGFKSVNGYNIEMNADEILYEATRGYYVQAKNGGCFLEIPETKDYPAHTAVVVRSSKNSLVTFYSVGPKGEANNSANYNTQKCQ